MGDDIMDMKVLWKGHLNKEKGFGTINYNLINELSKMGVKVLIDTPSNQPTKKLPAFFRAAKPKDFEKNLILITSQNQNEIRKGYKGYQIIYSAIDGSLPDPSLVSLKDEVNEIWLPSNHSANAAKKVFGRQKILVVPYGLDFELFNQKRWEHIGKRKKFTFVTVCRWTWRKAPELLIDTFVDTFKPNEADLIIVSAINDFPKMPKLTPNIHITNRLIRHDSLPQLYASCHAFVLPNRGEARGLPTAESGALGLPVIATRWGGQTEYLNDQNSFPIEIEGLISPPPETGKEKNNLFASPSRKNLKETLRFVYENYNEALRKAEKLQEDLKPLTWKAAAQLVFKRLKDISEGENL